MSAHRYTALVVAALVCVACGTEQTPQVSDAERAAIADTIRQLKGAIVEAFDGQDCDFDYPVSDSLLTVVDGHLMRPQRAASRADRIAGCQQMAAQRLSARDDIQEENVYVLGPTAAYIVTRSVYTVHRRDGRTIIRPQVATGIWSRQAEGWRLVHFHESWREAEQQTIEAEGEEDSG